MMERTALQPLTVKLQTEWLLTLQTAVLLLLKLQHLQKIVVLQNGALKIFTHGVTFEPTLDSEKQAKVTG